MQLPYEGNDASMIVILPNKKDGLAAVEKKLAPATFQGWFKELSPHTVDLKMPKFTMTSMFSLKDTLKAMGMTDAFDEISADLKDIGISMGDLNLYISDVVHKTFVGVDEKSTEAAAATGVIIKATKSARREPPPATCHPFLFVIRDNRTGTILFLGRVTNPS